MIPQIRAFLKQHHTPLKVDCLRDDESLLQSGIIDSALMIDLVMFLEQRFKVSIPEDDMTPENFDSLAAIQSFLSKRGGVAS